MATKSVPLSVARPRTRLLTETRLRWLTLACVVLWQVGAHIDVWYHLHFGFAIETFFT